VQKAENTEQSPEVNVHSYVEEPLEEPIHNAPTVVIFNEVQPMGAASPLRLPSETRVHQVMEDHAWDAESYTEVHFEREFWSVQHFTDYRVSGQTERNDISANVEESERRNEAEAQPYLEDPLRQLTKHIPELKGIQPATDQQALPMILKRTGKEVDEFLDHVVDLEAREEIQQKRVGGFGTAQRREPLRDNYLILLHGNRARADFDEFRMDEKGNRMDEADLGRGFLVTSGFALICVHFSSVFQSDSRFRYLGEQRIAGRDTYVVGFAQVPGEASFTVMLKGPSGTEVHMLTQGIAWVDEENFHILRMRTDLLARHPEIGLDEQTTKVNFSEVRFADVATPLWLPHDVNVYVKLGKFADRPMELEFRNVHHYTDYRRYRVSSKMVTPG
jgi:hypothetical protein